MEDKNQQPITKAEPENTPSSPTPKSANNQLTTGLIVIIVVLLFVMLMLSINGKLFNQTPSNNNLTNLQADNSQLRAEINAERSKRGLPPLPENTRTANAAADRIQRDATALATMANQWQSELKKKDDDLRALETQIAGHSQITQSLYNQISTLEAKLTQNNDATNQLVRLQNDLKIAQNQATNYQNQLAEFSTRPTNEQLSALRKQLSDSIGANDTLKLKIDQLENAAKTVVDRKLYEDASAELTSLRKTNQSQRYEIQKLRAELDRARLFITSEKNLPAEASRLFARLRTLEGTNKQQLSAAYEEMRASLGAEIVHRQTFTKGSSQIAFDQETLIRNILETRKDKKSFFLVVGYASKSGESETNQKLSARRATTVASIINALKATNQQVKAVYLGETNRFSPDQEIKNQICEVWEIKR